MRSGAFSAHADFVIDPRTLFDDETVKRTKLRSPRRLTRGGLGLVAWFVLVGCAEQAQVGPTSGAGGAGGTAGDASTGGALAKDASLPDVHFGYDGPQGEEDACATVSVEPEPAPLDLYVVLDRSGSLVNPQLGPERWPPVRDALSEFFGSSQAAGIGVALGMFAHPTLTPCMAASYETPLVAMAPLPGSSTGHAIALTAAMDSYAPILGVLTPTHSAIVGAISFAQTHKALNPTHVVAIVLATDGMPEAPSCATENSSAVTAAIAAAANAQPSIRTFVIGVDPTAEMSTNMSAWAAAGQGQFFDAATAAGPAELLQALDAVKSSLLGCVFSLPTTDSGVVDPTGVKVTFATAGSAKKVWSPVASPSACSGEGFFYDNNVAPTTIELCADSCAAVQAEPAGELKVEVACLGS